MSAINFIICISFYHEFNIGLVFQDCSNFAKNSFSTFGYYESSALEKQFIGDVNEYNALVNFNIDIRIISHYRRLLSGS